MRRRIGWLVLGFALAQLALPAGAVDTPEVQAPGVEAPEPPRRGGLFGIVREWFRGGTEEEDPRAPGTALAAAAPPVVETEPVLEAEPIPEAGSVLEAEPETTPQSASEPARTRRPAEDTETVVLASVHREARDLVAEIEVLRRAQGVTVEPVPAEPGDGHPAPTHAFLESLEVMEKAARVQRRFGMLAFEVVPLPAGDVALEDVHRNVRTVIEELRRVKRQLVVEERIEPAPLDANPAPALLHAHLAGASALLDGLVGRPVSSNDVYMHVLRVRAVMHPLAADLGVALELEPAAPQAQAEAKVSKEVAQQILIATYKVINLQSRLGMVPSDVPGAAPGDVTPGDVYEAANRLLVELLRIKTHLGIEAPTPQGHETRGMQPGDAFAQVQRLIADLDRMSKAVAGAG